MQIEIRLFVDAKGLSPENRPSTFLKNVENQVTVGQVVKDLGLPDDIPLILIVNHNHATYDSVLQEGDVINIFPPIAGG
jgi:molybdopterin converting factor small subunit